MTLGHEIEYIRTLRNLSVIEVCNTMGVTESEYRNIIYNHIHPTIYQLVMFISITRHPLESLL